MALFPKIDSPCPYKGRLADIMEGDVCRLCKREVFDLAALSDDERLAFLSSCREEICVSYKLPLRPAIASVLAAAAMGAPTLVAAQEVEVEEDYIIVGGIKDPSSAEYIEVDDEAPQMPVVYDDPPEPADAATPDADSLPAADLSHRVEPQ